MGTFHVHESHRIERLAGELALLFDAPRGGPFDPEAVVVPGRGMSVWLSMQLSKELGVWAMPFTYPRMLVERVVCCALGEEALGPEPLSEPLIEWCVRATLPTLIDQPEFAELRRYLEGDEHGARLSELSARIAAVFDQYLTYRPHWIRAWQGGGVASAPGDERWQALLFHRVAQRLRHRHVAHVEDAVLTRLGEARPLNGLPPRVSLFGLSTMPPLYLRVFVALSRHVDVHWFRFAAGPGAGSRPPADEPLARLGTAGDELASVLRDTLEHQGIVAERHEYFERPSSGGLLAALQARLAEPGVAPAPTSVPIEPTSTVSVHACHGPMREVEVLHDQLLAVLTRRENPVKPDEVAVLVPKIEEYAPLIEAVFGRDREDRRFIPFRVADRSARRESPGFDAFLRVLALVRGRVTAADVADLFAAETVLARLGLDAEGADRIKGWIVESGIRYGIDGAHLESIGLPGDGALTWQFGLRRLLLGYAMPSSKRRTFRGVMGYDEVEGHDGALLGVLAGFVRTLTRTLRDFERPRSLPDWTLALGELARELFADDEAGSREISGIQRALELAGRQAAAAGFSGDLDVSTVRRLLERQADAAGAERGFLAGGVTFSAMVPMRSVPFKVIALLGMNDGAFPKMPRPFEFDLMQTAREPGDRSPRDDDRQLFLETLFAARERLIVTYGGKSVRDDREMPTSTCLTGLIEALVGAPGPEADARRKALVVPHRLQGYSPAYFDDRDTRLFSFRDEYVRAAASVQGRSEVRPFVQTLPALPLPATLPLDELIRFWKSPPAYLLNRRLGVYLKERRPEIMTRELLVVSALDNWHVATPLINELIDEPNAEVAVTRIEAQLRAEGRLPVGGWGRWMIDKQVERCQKIAAEVKTRRRGALAMDAAIDIELDGWPRLQGSLTGVHGGGLVEYGYSGVRARYQLELWIRHLALSASSVHPPRSGVRIGRNKDDAEVVEFLPLARDQARAELAELVRLYFEGLCRPLPFLPAESQAYAENLLKEGKKAKTPREALAAAVRAYDGGDMSTLAFDPHPQRAFDYLLPPFDAACDRGTRRIEDTEFHRLSLRIVGSYLGAKSEESS